VSGGATTEITDTTVEDRKQDQGVSMKTRITTVALGLALAAVTATHAKDVEKAEVEKSFATMDANKDGSIDKAEFEVFVQGYIAKQKADFDKEFAELDVNGDGRIAPDEAAANAGLEAYFDQVDENSDGFVTKEEIASAMAAAKEANVTQ
jgi:Ca2+-binding EF-hand superfamily protein